MFSKRAGAGAGNADGRECSRARYYGYDRQLSHNLVPTCAEYFAHHRRSAVPGTRDVKFSAVQGAAQLRGVEVSPVGDRDAAEIERAVATFAHSANGGLIATGPAGASVYRELIIQLAARHKLPAVYADSYIVAEGGLISYGPDRIDQYRNAANYVDRILRGEKPANLPVQAPTKYELVINLKTAKALGLEVPPSLLARADEVIE
jgi:putative ABC transport system substrate-binding protein